MKRVTGIAAGTKPDRQGEALHRTALDAMVRDSQDVLVMMTPEHDPLRPPVGRVVSVRIVDRDDGHAEVEIEAEVWEAGDTPEDLPAYGKSLRVRDHPDPELGFGIRYRGAPAKELSEKLLPNLAPRARPRYIARKGLVEGIPDVVLWFGVFVAGGVFNGLLAAAGKDAWIEAKKTLRGWFGSASRDAESLEVAFGVRTREGVCVEVVCILPAATHEELRSFLEDGLPAIDQVLLDVLERDPTVRKSVFQWSDGAWGLHFTVDEHGFPSRIEPMEPSKLMGMGLSVTASASAELLQDPFVTDDERGSLN